MINTINYIDLTGIDRTLYHKTVDYIFCSSTPGTFPISDHKIGHKTILNKYKNIKVILSIFSNHIGMELELGNIRKTEHFKNMWKLSNIFLNNQ